MNINRVFCLTIITAVLLAAGFYLTEPQEIHSADKYEANVSLTSLNANFTGEAALITEHNEPLNFQCEIDITPPVPDGYTAAPIEFEWSVDSGRLTGQGNVCTWHEPEPGVQTITVKGVARYLAPESGGFFTSQKPEIRVPFEASYQCVIPRYVESLKSQKIDDFEVGYYPDPLATKDLEDSSTPNRIKKNYLAYQPPKLFYKVTPENFFLEIFNKYKLGEFDLDPRFYDVKYPRYVAIHPNILKKLELLRLFMNEQGHEISKFKFIYAFRCPNYNANARSRDGEETLKASFSMHMYGKAVDMIIDEDNNLIMDDLNKDGQISRADAEVLFDAVYALDQELREQGSELIGGRGLYFHHDYYERGEVAQTPYVHMDVRGFTREDGSLIFWEDPDKIGVLEMENPYTLKKPIPPYPFAEQHAGH